jgi:hypothetical protein
MVRSNIYRFDSHKNLKNYGWLRNWRGGVIDDDRLAHYNTIISLKRSEKDIRKYIDIDGNRIGSKSVNAEVYQTPHNEALKIVPMSLNSQNELETFSRFVLDGGCAHFPLFYSNVCYDDIVYQNESINFDACDGLVVQNRDICHDYIIENINL